MRVQNYIGGQWVEAHSGAVFSSINPATEYPVAEVANSDTRDVEAAVEAAPRRGEILYRAGLRLLEQKEELAQLLTREMGKVIAEARGDMQEAIDMAFYLGGEGRRLLGYGDDCYGTVLGRRLRDRTGIDESAP